ncbi:helix-turn-helix domain-containing protein [Rhodobacteraceae bacterium NNCM2]|nr:helix-turn-helix domain-containing protein [Coraliihabitans acroporae]
MSRTTKRANAEFDWLRSIAADRNLPPLATAIAVHLTRYFNAAKGGEAWPSIGRLCAELGIEKRTIQRVLRALDDAGYIARELGSGKATTRYRMLSGVTQVSPGGCQDCHPRGVTVVTPGVTQVSPITLLENPSKEPPKVQKSLEGCETSSFEAFYAQYPRKTGKRAAEKAYRKAIDEGALPSDLIAGAMRYAAERDGEDPRFTKHPATWLNKGCWEDEATEQPAHHRNGEKPKVSASQFVGMRAAAIGGFQ